MANMYDGEASRADVEVSDVFLMTRQGPSFGHFIRFVTMRRIEEERSAYESLAAGALDHSVKSFFLAMARLKAEQALAIGEYGENGRHFSMPDNVLPPVLLGTAVEATVNSLEEGCKLAFRFELGNYCLYIHLAELEEDLSTKKLFLLLVKLHKSNMHYIEDRLQELSADRR